MKRLVLILMLMFSISGCSTLLSIVDFMLEPNVVDSGKIEAYTLSLEGGVVCLENLACYEITDPSLIFFRGIELKGREVNIILENGKYDIDWKD